MTVTTSGFYTSNTMDLCAGNSGGAIVDAGALNALVAIASGEIYATNGACIKNVFVPQINDPNINEPAGCTRSTGGASIPCLSRILPA